MRSRTNLRRFLPVSVLLGACLLSVAGCGGGEKVVSVYGKVTHKGQPVGGLIISFVPQARTKTGPSTGQTDDNGKYELSVADSGDDGAVVGTHKVWVSLPREPPTPRTDKRNKNEPRGPQMSPLMADIIRKYGSLEKTPLTVEVTSSGPIDLQLD
jgi:hypothetical protein